MRRTLLLAALLASGSARAQDIAHREGGMDALSGADAHSIVKRVDAIADGVVRVRVPQSGNRFDEDASWAVGPGTRRTRVKVQPTQHGFRTPFLSVEASGPPGSLVFGDSVGRAFMIEKFGALFATGLDIGIGADEHFFALGDKTGGLDRRGGAFVDWNTDVGRFTSSTDPLYKSIPFLISVGGPAGAYGIFFDNTGRVSFDIGKTNPERLSIRAAEGPVDYYVIAGPTVRDVVRRYVALTGKAPLAPLWALGYQQSRYSYMTQDEVAQVAERLKQDRIPTDVIWLDIDFQDRNRPFTIDRKAFPAFEDMVRGLKSQGIRTVTITDLHIAQAEDGYAPYASGSDGDHFVRDAAGQVVVGPLWPGPSVFPEFTAAKSRAWWGSLYKDFLDAGVAGFWNDMNEPALFVPSKTMTPDARHRIASDDFAPRTATHAEIHNVYGMLNTRATFEGLRRLRPDERPFVMTRATYAGGQRYAVTWTGDNSSTWEHLKMSVHQLINLGLSGFGYAAADIGGFTGGASPELLTRWYQIGAWTPVFRNHSAKDAPRAEPWVDGQEHLALRRAAIEERYRLLPYFYALADQNARAGDPIMRPVFYDHPALAGAWCDQSMAFAVGRDLIVAPAPTPESPQAYDVCLPEAGWYDYWTGARVVQKPRPAPSNSPFQQPDDVRTVETPTLARLPVFVRPGAIIPKQAVVRNSAQVPDGPIELHVYPGGDCAGTIYADDGTSLAYTRGVFLRQQVRCAETADGVAVTLDAVQGRWRPWWRQVKLVVHGWAPGGVTVTRGRKTLPGVTDARQQTASVILPYRPNAVAVRFRRLDRASPRSP